MDVRNFVTHQTLLMKSLISYLLTLAICTSASSQSITIPKDSLDKIIQGTLNKMLDDKLYTRIPNTQFDDIMIEKISSTIDNKFQKLYWYVGVIGAILGSLLFYSGNRFLKDSVKNKFTEESTSIQDSIQKTLMTEINTDVQKIKKEMEEKLKEITAKLENSTSQIEDAKKEILYIRIEKIKNELDTGKVTEETFKSLMKSLKESENMINNALTAEILLSLSRASYLLQKETEMEKIVQTYMHNENIKIDSSIFLNLASGFFYNYYATQDVNEKAKCLFYLNESLKILPTYGEAYALKLEILMLEYSRTMDTDTEARQKIIHEAEPVLQLSEDSAATAKFFVERFDRVGNSKIEGNYIKLLQNLFPDEWKRISALAKP